MTKYLDWQVLFLVLSKNDSPYQRLQVCLAEHITHDWRKYKAIMQMLILTVGTQGIELFWHAALRTVCWMEKGFVNNLPNWRASET